MKKQRLDLHNKLLQIDDSLTVYYRLPENIKLIYPCIIYKRSDIKSDYADNTRFLTRVVYDVTLISKDPDNECVNKLLNTFPYISYDRSFTKDGLHHDFFTLEY